jgi:tetratricopeptide (TPR) repeat protein
MLTAGEALFEDAPGSAHLSVQRARIARKLGELEVAEALYERAARTARRTQDAGAVGRAWIGRGIVARRRGNYPASRAHYQRALAVGRRIGDADLLRDAHHGMLIVSGASGDHARALVHGWEAFQRSQGDATKEAEILGNLGAVCTLLEAHEAGAGAYGAAASRTASTRVRLPALAGLAVCLAHLGDVEGLETVTAHLERLLVDESLPYERATALTRLGEAWGVLSAQPRAVGYAERGLALAREYAFHELTFEADAVLSGARAVAHHAPTGPTAAGAGADRSADAAAPPRAGGAARVLSSLAMLPDRSALLAHA